MTRSLLATVFVLPLFSSVLGHIALFHPSMYGFNVTDKTFDYDNRPVVPIKNMNFQKWWFHNHLDYPPNDGDIFELPAGKPATAELACTRGATSYHEGVDGGDIRDPNNPNNPCPGAPVAEYHTTGLDDVKGCALAISYKNDARQVQPEDFVVFSVNQTCVWNRFTDFSVPERMPPCPEGGCTCAWFWIHSKNSGGEENYMNGFKCNITGSTSDVPLAEPKVPRRCGKDPENQKFADAPGNCTYGAKAPFYWFNTERNNMFEGFYSPPFYNDLYNFKDGAQDDIFIDSYDSLPDPSPNAALPVLKQIGDNSRTTAPSDQTTNGNTTSTETTSSPIPSSTSDSGNIKKYKKCRRVSSLTARSFTKRSRGAHEWDDMTGFMKIQSLFRNKLTF
jgi:hypothetical protein